MRRVALTLNGEAITAEVEPRLNVADFVREQRLLTGTHVGCEHGVCGACTLLIDGAPARSCITFAAACEGAEVRTIEGLENDPVMQRLRAAFTAEHALQCGYCTPGMLVTARDIVLRLPQADAARIRLELAGNLCRCTGYAGIVHAIRRVLDEGVAEAAPTATALPAMAVSPVAAESAPASPALSPASAGPSTTLSVTVGRPRAEIWAALHNPALLAECVPGATLVSIEGTRLVGEMRVALGPITATFTGTGDLRLDEAAHSAFLTGGARDRRSATHLSGEARFVLTGETLSATRVDLDLRYALRGPLGQFARGPVVQLLAAEMAGTVARNLEAKLAGRAPSAPARLSALGLMAHLVWTRLRSLLRRA